MSRLIEPPHENPKIPFTARIPGGATVGLVIRVRGSVPHNANQFSVNLACGYAEANDVVFRFNPKFEHGYVARNTKSNDSWGKEEGRLPCEDDRCLARNVYSDGNCGQTVNDHLPFSRGNAFEIQIMLGSENYLVAVDGFNFIKYSYWIQLSEVVTLKIKGDVEIHAVEFLDKEVPRRLDDVREVYSPTLPFALSLVGGLAVGCAVTVTGKPKPEATSFYVNLERTSRGSAKDDLFFQVVVRFAGQGGERDSVLAPSSRLGSVNGLEERRTHLFPFTRGFFFDLTIMCQQLHFLVIVDGQHLLTFKHGGDCQMVDLLSVGGEIDLIRVKI